MAVVIETMQECDLDEVMRIEQATFKFPWKRNFFVADLSHVQSHMIVAHDTGSKDGAGCQPQTTDGRSADIRAPGSGSNERLVGYAVSWEVEDELHLANIAVDADVRHAGIGTLLLQRVFEIGHECGSSRIYLEVRRSNVAAQSFYRKHGFFQTGTREAYYPDKEDAFILERELS